MMIEADDSMTERIRWPAPDCLRGAAAALRGLVAWLTDSRYKPERHYMRGRRSRAMPLAADPRPRSATGYDLPVRRNQWPVAESAA
jgi:hypothetical protein